MKEVELKRLCFDANEIESGVEVDNNDAFVCVCACPLVMRGLAVNHALTSTSCPPNDIPSIPWSPVVLPLWTP